jgi:predicted nucleic acid-binding protein
MIVLDTNVISELMRPQTNASVLGWVDAQGQDELFVTAVTVGEVLYGIARLPEGKRKSDLRSAADETFDVDFIERVRAFDKAAAEHYSHVVSQRERSGRPISMADGLIASICLSYSASLATRNIADFEGVGLELINPWDDVRETPSPSDQDPLV